MKSKILGLTVFASLAFAPMAAASTIFTFTSATNANGVAGTAAFEFTGAELILTLDNTTLNVTKIAQELDGISWSGFSLTGVPVVGASGVVDCNAGASCPADVLSTSPYGWVMVGTTQLGAGGTAFHPYAIVDTYTAPQWKTNGNGSNNNGGIRNDQHNPLLIGPVTFTFAYTAAIPTSIPSVTFYWGTNPDTTSGSCTSGANCIPTVPEPASLVLLGSGLLGAALFARRKKK